MSEQYVPTTEQVRLEYATSFLAAHQQDAREGFDRWLAATLEGEERFCHLCCAGLESSQHNTDCIGSDNGLAAHDREVRAEAWDEGVRHGEACDGGMTCPGDSANPYRIESQETP